MPFLDRLNYWAEHDPDEIAVVIGDDPLTWSALRDRAIVELGETCTPSLLIEGNSTTFPSKFAAAVAGGGLCAVLDPTWPSDQVKAMVEMIGQKIPSNPGASVVTTGFDRPPRVPRGKTPEGQDSKELVDGDLDADFLIGFTSGTTSIPKAFTRTRRSWRASFEASTAFFGLRREDRTLAPGPLAASLNLYALAECIYAGSSFHTLTQFDVGDAHASIVHDGITRLVVVPTMLRLLSERGLAGGVDASGLSSIICAGSKLDARTLEGTRRWAPNARVYEYYGASELSFVAGQEVRFRGVSDEGRWTDVGAPFPGVTLRILNEDGTDAAEGQPGSIFVRSDMISNGYLWEVGEGGLCTVDDWHSVGDDGFLEHGVLHILGRQSDLIITSGRNVYPHEIELALASIPGIASAVAVGVPDDLRGERIVAGIVPSCGPVTPTHIRNGLEGQLSRYKRPVQYFELGAVPMTDRGKISRGLFREWVLGRDARLKLLT